MSNLKEILLKDIAYYGPDRVDVDRITLNNYISTENMIPNRKGITQASTLPSARTVTKYSHSDILISNIRPYFKKIWFAVNDGGCSNDVLVIRNKRPDIIDCKYLYYSLFTDSFFDYVMSGAKGAKMPRGDKEEIMKFSLSIPPLSIQKKVAAFLSNIDSKIQLNTQMNQTLEEMAMTLYKHWFIDIGPFQNGVFVESELGMIPEGWEAIRLNEFADINMGQSPKSEYYNNEGIGLPFHQGIKDFSFRYPNHQTFCSIEKKVAKSGDILLSVRAPVGRMNLADRSIVIGRGLCGIRSKSEHQSFLYYKLRDVFKTKDSMGSGTVFNSINKKDIESIKVLVPNAEALQKFEDIVSKWDDQIRKNTQELNILKNIRDYLLPKLLSGEIDLSEAEETIENVIQ